jgi:enoyl-CoA hydratase/carnithine racemase
MEAFKVSNQTIIFEQRNQAAWIYLNRPKDMNAISKTLLMELGEAFEKARTDERIKVIVLTGKGRAFCAGADLKELLEDLEGKKSAEPDLLDLCERTFGLLEHCPKPLIAALNGITLAGGLEFAMTADIVIAAESAKIGDAHSNFGVLPGAGGAVKLPRKIGVNRAKYLLFTGDFISATEMKDYGFVQQVVADEELEATAQALADKLAMKSPLVLRRMKQLVRDGLEQPLDIALRQELLTLRAHTESYDMAEGLAAFAEKRKPNFKGY